MVGHDLVDEAQQARALERVLQHAQLVEHTTERPHVGLPVIRLAPRVVLSSLVRRGTESVQNRVNYTVIFSL